MRGDRVCQPMQARPAGLSTGRCSHLEEGEAGLDVLERHKAVALAGHDTCVLDCAPAGTNTWVVARVEVPHQCARTRARAELPHEPESEPRARLLIQCPGGVAAGPLRSCQVCPVMCAPALAVRLQACLCCRVAEAAEKDLALCEDGSASPAAALSSHAGRCARRQRCHAVHFAANSN